MAVLHTCNSLVLLFELVDGEVGFMRWWRGFEIRREREVGLVGWTGIRQRFWGVRAAGGVWGGGRLELTFLGGGK